MNIGIMIDNKWIQDNLRKTGKSQAELARHLRRDPAAITRLLNGKRQLKSSEEAEIRSFFQQPLVPNGMTEHIPGNSLPNSPLASLPEYGTAAATNGMIEGVGLQYPIDYLDIRIPEGCFVIRINGISMEPRYRHGEAVIVHANKKPLPMQDCLIRMRDDSGYVKTYLKETKSTLICQQYNPDGKFELPASQVKSVHAIIGKWG